MLVFIVQIPRYLLQYLNNLTEFVWLSSVQDISHSVQVGCRIGAH